MQLTDAYRLTALRHARQFLADHADRLAPVTQTGAARRLDAVLAGLSALVNEQAAATIQARVATQRLHALRRRLIEDHLAPITSIAHVDLAGTPELAPFRLPRRTTPVERLAGMAHGMAEAAAPHAAIFIAAGLPPDFIDRLGAAVDALVEARTDRDSCRNRVRGATAGISSRLAEGRRIIGVLHTFVRSAVRDDEELLVGWLSVRAVPDLPGRRRRRAVPADATLPTVLSAPATSFEGPSRVEALQRHREVRLLPSPMLRAEADPLPNG